MLILSAIWWSSGAYRISMPRIGKRTILKETR